MDQVFKALELLMTIGGPVLIVYAIVAFIRTQRFVRNCVETVGEVIRLESSSGGDGLITYAPVFLFAVADGSTYTVASDVSSCPAGFKVGDRAKLQYDPANPEDARIETFFQTWGGAVISGAVGIGFLVLGLNFLGLVHWLTPDR